MIHPLIKWLHTVPSGLLVLSSCSASFSLLLIHLQIWCSIPLARSFLSSLPGFQQVVFISGDWHYNGSNLAIAGKVLINPCSPVLVCMLSAEEMNWSLFCTFKWKIFQTPCNTAGSSFAQEQKMHPWQQSVTLAQFKPLTPKFGGTRNSY